MIRTQVQLTEEQWNALKELSATRRESIAEIIRQSLDLYLRSTSLVSQEEIRKRALAVVGKYHSDGPTDLSTHHDQYLADIFGS